MKHALSNQRRVANDAFSLIGKAEAAAEDMATITEERFDTSDRVSLSKSDRKSLEAQKIEVIDKYDTVESEWRERRDTLGMLFSLYHHNDLDVMTSWNKTSSALTVFIDCERSFQEQMSRKGSTNADDSTKTTCYEPEKRNLIGSEQSLVRSLVESEK